MSTVRVHFNPNTLLAAFNENTQKLIVSPVIFGGDSCCFLDPSHEYWHPATEYSMGDFVLESSWDRRESSWSSTKTYPAQYLTRVSLGGDPLQCAFYRSLQGNNLNNPPASSPSWWLYLGQGICAQSPRGGVFRSNTNNNIGNMTNNSGHWNQLTNDVRPCGNQDWNSYSPYGGPGRTPQFYKIYPSGIKLHYSSARLYGLCPHCGQGFDEDCEKAIKWKNDPAATWLGTTTYNTNDLSFYDGDNYRSLQDNNLNNPPASSPSWWQRLPNTGVLSKMGQDSWSASFVFLVRCINGHWFQPKNENDLWLYAQATLHLKGGEEFTLQTACGELTVHAPYADPNSDDIVFIQTFPNCQVTGNLSNAMQTKEASHKNMYYCFNQSSCQVSEYISPTECPSDYTQLFYHYWNTPASGGSIGFHPL